MDADTSDEDMKQIDEPEDENADSAETADAGKQKIQQKIQQKMLHPQIQQKLQNSQEYYIIFRL